MKRFAIFGAGGCGREVLPIARNELQHSGDLPWDLSFVDDGALSQTINDTPVLRYEQWLQEPAESRHACIAVANSKVRAKLVERCIRDGVSFFNIRAMSAVTMDDVKIGAGSILCPFVTLTSNIVIGDHFHANYYSYVAHDCRIGDFVTFAPGVHCNGNVVIEDHAYIGSGAILRQGRPDAPLIVGKHAVVGMGAVVTKSVAAGATVVGNPARTHSPRSA